MKEVFIIGGGESLKGFDFSTLKNKNTIAVNYAINYVPNCKVLVAFDTNYHIMNSNFLESWSGTCYTDRDVLMQDNIIYVPVVQSPEWGKVQPYVCCFNNSGLAAINIAWWLGYDKINLLGFDFTGGNFHYGNEIGGTKINQNWFSKTNEKYKRLLQDININIVNLNPNSKFLI